MQGDQSETHSFLTGSSHTGCFINSTHTMEGLGIYEYPDGTEYRGYFKSGHFHGYGRIKFPPPKNFLIFGYFKNDEIVKIDEMFFIDGLRFKGDIYEEDNKLILNTDNWKYLTADDRRYTRERIFGLDAVAPKQSITSEVRTRDLPKDSYDTEEGILKSSTGFIVDIQNDALLRRFVSCKKEMDWLKKNCRKSNLTKQDTVRKHEIPIKEFRDQITSANLNALSQLDDTNECSCNPERKFMTDFHAVKINVKKAIDTSSDKEFFPNIDKESNDSDDEAYAKSPSEASTKSSINSNYLIEQLSKRCEQELRKLHLRKVTHTTRLDAESEDDCIKRRSVSK